MLLIFEMLINLLINNTEKVCELMSATWHGRLNIHAHIGMNTRVYSVTYCDTRHSVMLQVAIEIWLLV